MLNLRTRHWAICALAFSVGALLSACGGGGGGASNSPGPAVPATPTREVPLVFDGSEQLVVSVLTMAFGESLLGFGQLAHDWTAMLTASREPVVSEPCDGGGTSLLRLIDRDGNRRPTAGDQIEVVLTKCYVRVADDVLDGTLTIELTATNEAGFQEAGTITFGSRMVIVDSGGDIRFEGGLRFIYGSGPLSSALKVTSSAVPFTVMLEASTDRREVTSALVLEKTVRRDTAQVTNHLQMRVASDEAKGSFEVRTASPFVSWFDTAPISGELVLTGATAEPVRLSADSGRMSLTSYFRGRAEQLSLSDNDSNLGFLWWAAGITEPGPGARGFATKADTPFQFSVAVPSKTSLAQSGDGLRWQLSRPAKVPTYNTTVDLRLVTTRPGGFQWASPFVTADIKVQGALVSVTPREPLQPGATYTTTTLIELNHLDSALYLSLPPFVFNVNDSIQAQAQAPATLLGPTARLRLDGSASKAAGGEVSSAKWRQISGPTLSLSADDTLTPEIAIANATSDSGEAVLELEVRNAAGEFDRTQVSTFVLNNRGPFAAVRHDMVGKELPRWASNTKAGSSGTARSFQYDNPNRYGIQVSITEPSVSSIFLQASKSTPWVAGQTLAVDSLSDALVTASVPGSPNCETLSGSIKVLEFEPGSGPDVNRLAIDVVINCRSGDQRRFAVRANSILATPF